MRWLPPLKLFIRGVRREPTCREIEEIIGLDATDAMEVSAKNGLGVAELLEKVVEVIPAPEDRREGPLQALIIDSWFDNYLGVVSLVRVVQGRIAKKDRILAKSIGRVQQVDAVGIFTPHRKETDVLNTGEVGFVVAGIKDVKGAPVGDTIVLAGDADSQLVPVVHPILRNRQIFPNIIHFYRYIISRLRPNTLTGFFHDPRVGWIGCDLISTLFKLTIFPTNIKLIISSANFPNTCIRI